MIGIKDQSLDGPCNNVSHFLAICHLEYEIGIIVSLIIPLLLVIKRFSHTRMIILVCHHL